MEKGQSVINTGFCEIWFETKEILRVRIVEGAEMDLTAMKDCFSVYRQILGRKKIAQLIDARAVCSVTTEAKEYSAMHSQDFFRATALVTDQLSVRLLVNFYNKLHQHPVPFEIFKTEEEARMWLKQLAR